MEIFASLTDGIGVLFGSEARLSCGMALLYRGGRDEEDGDLLRGLAAIDAAAIVVASASYAPSSF